MILADIYVPSLNTVYDFLLNEEKTAAELIESITAILCLKTGETDDNCPQEWILCSADKRCILHPEHTLLQ